MSKPVLNTVGCALPDLGVVTLALSATVITLALVSVGVVWLVVKLRTW